MLPTLLALLGVDITGLTNQQLADVLDRMIQQATDGDLMLQQTTDGDPPSDIGVDPPSDIDVDPPSDNDVVPPSSDGAEEGGDDDDAPSLSGPPSQNDEGSGDMATQLGAMLERELGLVGDLGQQGREDPEAGRGGGGGGAVVGAVDPPSDSWPADNGVEGTRDVAAELAAMLDMELGAVADLGPQVQGEEGSEAGAGSGVDSAGDDDPPFNSWPANNDTEGTRDLAAELAAMLDMELGAVGDLEPQVKGGEGPEAGADGGVDSAGDDDPPFNSRTANNDTGGTRDMATELAAMLDEELGALDTFGQQQAGSSDGTQLQRRPARSHSARAGSASTRRSQRLRQQATLDTATGWVGAADGGGNEELLVNLARPRTWIQTYRWIQLEARMGCGIQDPGSRLPPLSEL